MASVQNQTGAALVVALLLLLVLVTLVPVAMNVTSLDIGRTTSYTDERDLFYLAEAGLEHGKTVVVATGLDILLAGPDGDKTSLGDNGTFAGVGSTTVVSWNGNAYDDVAFGNGTYYFRVYDNDDGDGDLYADLDSVVFIDGVGLNAAGDTKTLRAMVRRFVPPPVTLPAAVTLTGPTSVISTGGNAFSVSGSDSSGFGYGIDGLQDTSCAGQNAVATEATGTLQLVGNNQEASCTSPACFAGSSSTYENFTGVDGGEPAVETGQTDFSGQDGEDLRDQLVDAGPDYTFSSDTTYGGNDTIGTADDPVVMHFEAGAKITGDLHGYGVLIVDGDLDIQGSLTWDGIIIIGACTTCSCPTCPGALTGTGSATIHGAMVVGNTVDATAEFTGSANIKYSCEGVDIASNIFNTVQFTVASWNEVD